MTAMLDALQAAGALDDVDVHFARFLLRHAPPDDGDGLALAAALASHATGRGDVCVDLGAVAGRPVMPDPEPAGTAAAIVAPGLTDWRSALAASGVVGMPGTDRPLVLDAANRLYLHRYWAYERIVADALAARAGVVEAVDEAGLRADLDALFPRAGGAVDWQRVAAATAVLRRLCVISGGPGTGKTSTVVRILALLARQAGGAPAVALAAPTGKAAARMQEAVATAAAGLPAALAAAIPTGATTIHRLLGARRDGTGFRHDARNPLPHRVVVVDEASMVDLALMAKLVRALRDDARLVLLGDRDQLASVEAGAVLGDVCGPAPGFSAAFAARVSAVTGETVPAGADDGAHPLCDAVVLLRHSWRFGGDSGIGRVAAAVNAGDAAAVGAILRAGAADVAWRGVASPAELRAALDDVAGGFAEMVAAAATGDAGRAFAALARVRVLCALRRGPFGVEGVNAAIAALLAARGLADTHRDWFAGRPVLVTENDYNLRVFNGDVGIAVRDDEGRLCVCFEGPSGARIAPSRLPTHETAFAMTVHKSQGSEFDEVVLVLPPEAPRILTRELVYTGVTRARQRVAVWGTEPALASAVGRRLERSSGLRDTLWGDPG